jgi:hypothetical protein
MLIWSMGKFLLEMIHQIPLLRKMFQSGAGVGIV